MVRSGDDVLVGSMTGAAIRCVLLKMICNRRPLSNRYLAGYSVGKSVSQLRLDALAKGACFDICETDN